MWLVLYNKINSQVLVTIYLWHQTSVGDDPWLHQQLVEQLVDYNDMPEAARWAKHYDLPEDKLPYQIVGMMDSVEG